MKKLNETIYNKMQLQAMEAKEQGMFKLGEAVDNAIDVETLYSKNKMNDDIHKDLWKIATKLMIFHDVEGNVDISKLDNTIIRWAAKMIKEIEAELKIEDDFSKDEKLPGKNDLIYGIIWK